MTSISPACLPPVQPFINKADQTHPLFDEYMNWRSAMSRQLVRADSFNDWLYQRKLNAEAKQIVSHPRHPAYVKWLRENVNCKPAKCKYKNIWQWVADGER